MTCSEEEGGVNNTKIIFSLCPSHDEMKTQWEHPKTGKKKRCAGGLYFHLFFRVLFDLLEGQTYMQGIWERFHVFKWPFSSNHTYYLTIRFFVCVSFPQTLFLLLCNCHQRQSYSSCSYRVILFPQICHMVGRKKQTKKDRWSMLST